MKSHLIGTQNMAGMHSMPMLMSCLTSILFHKTILGRATRYLLLATCTGYMRHPWGDEVLLALGFSGEGLRLDNYICFIQNGAQLVTPGIWWHKSHALSFNLSVRKKLWTSLKMMLLYKTAYLVASLCQEIMASVIDNEEKVLKHFNHLSSFL